MEKKGVRLVEITGLIIALFGCVAAWLVVPPIQKFLNLSYTPTLLSPAIEVTRITQQAGNPQDTITPSYTQTSLNNVITPTKNEVVMGDIPGTPLEIGKAKSSVLDQDTKKRDVYSVDLNAGQTIYVTIETNRRLLIYYAKPGFSTFEAKDGEFFGDTSNTFKSSFVAATTGTYYLMVKANDSGIKYQISITVESTAVSQAASDVPGIRIQPGVPIVSVLDQETKKRDVYSVDLNAGQTIYVTIETNRRLLIYYAKPGFSTFEAKDGEFFGDTSSTFKSSFVAATTGTYYLMVKANDSGIKYDIQITIAQ